MTCSWVADRSSPLELLASPRKATAVTPTRLLAAVLDDYQRVGATFGPWGAPRAGSRSSSSPNTVCDEAALLLACRDGQICQYGACLDVFDEEPLPAGHPLRSLPKVLSTPHIGYVTERTYEAFFADVIEDIERWLDRSPIRVVSD